MTVAPRRFTRRSVRMVVVTGLVVTVAIALGTVTWRNFVFTRQLLFERASTEMATAVEGAGARLDALIAARLDAVRTAAQNPRIVAAARGDTAVFDEARRTIEALLRQDPVHNMSAAIVDTLRNLRVATDVTVELGGGRVVRDLPYPIVIAYPDSAGDVNAMAFLASIRDANGKQIGILGLRTRITALSQILGDGASAQLKNQLLRVRQLSGGVVTAWPLPAPGKVKPRPQAWDSLPPNAELLAENVLGTRIRERRLAHSSRADVLRETSIRLASVPWYVSSTADEQALLAPARLETRRTLWFSLGVLAVVALLAFVAGGRFAERIERLAEVVRRIASGERSARVTVDGAVEEVQQLGQDVNAMAMQLDGLVTSLEERGRQLEAELEERALLEERLIEARRMEAIGQLAGTVAHDFNNVLTIVTTAAEGAQREVAPNTLVHEDLGQIIMAAARGGEITQRLLSLARRGDTLVSAFDAVAFVREHVDMLKRLLRPDVRLVVNVSERPLPIRADRIQLLQALLNLVANARDAIGDHSGIVTITAGPFDGVPLGIIGTGTPPSGPCIEIAVQDTGTGMTSDTLARLTEPYFTTKPRGRGTGLGLASVARTMALVHGALSVVSSPGEGSRFALLLPLADESSAAPAGSPSAVR